ncbi:hypothetical protein Loshitsa2_00006 [Erwinia phage Loshitsa2]|uniref:Uncharacterized protein n=1 Tax=Erwinia phage Loshitsa2 TaxID=2923254 RepID=A0AAE9FMG3_9CAUD|nr:hypothetical protein Loshitsa2_00006 [Erwinia phage Loshitsa2]
MTIKLRAAAPKPKHNNPDLKQGQTYRIIGSQSPSYTDYIGRYFVAAMCGGYSHLVYLHDTTDFGGYDGVNVVRTHGLEFVQVDLTEA